MKAGRAGLFAVGFVAAALSVSAGSFGSDALVAHVSGVHALEFVDGQTLISGGSDGAVKRWKLNRPAEPHPLRGDAAATKPTTNKPARLAFMLLLPKNGHRDSCGHLSRLRGDERSEPPPPLIAA